MFILLRFAGSERKEAKQMVLLCGGFRGHNSKNTLCRRKCMKRKQNWKKSLALLLAMAMCLSLVPAVQDVYKRQGSSGFLC